MLIALGRQTSGGEKGTGQGGGGRPGRHLYSGGNFELKKKMV